MIMDRLFCISGESGIVGLIDLPQQTEIHPNFQLTMNLAAVFINFVAAVSPGNLPFTIL